MLPLTEVGASPSLSAEGPVTGFGLAGPVQDRSIERSPICSMPRAGQRRAHTGTKDVTPLVSTIEHTRLSQDSYGALGRGHWVGQSRPVGIGHVGQNVIPTIALDAYVVQMQRNDDQCCDESVSFRQPVISESL